jgi:hypothetical protein
VSQEGTEVTARRYAHTRPTADRTGGTDTELGHCRLDPYWFDQAAGDARANDLPYAIRQAKAICAGCPLTGLDGPCLKQNADVPGVVAGMTKQERGALNRIAKCGTISGARRHRKKGESMDLACRQAEAADVAKRRARKGAAA